jgi:hypothetical protein
VVVWNITDNIVLWRILTDSFSKYTHVIEEGRAVSKSPHEKFGYFLSMSQRAVSADIIPNSAV